VFKGKRFTEKSILDIKTHYKPTETFQYTHFTSCHPPGVKRGFIKGEAIRLLRTNSSKTTYEECLANFKRRLEARGYPKKYIQRSLSEVIFDSRQSALKPQNQQEAISQKEMVFRFRKGIQSLRKAGVLCMRSPGVRGICVNAPLCTALICSVVRAWGFLAK